MADTPTLVRFYTGSKFVGNSDNGMPLYESCIMILLARPPYLQLERPATQEDFDEHPKPFELYQKEETARVTTYAEGYPLNMWPPVDEACLKMLAARDIVTVEQLAKLNPKEKGMPAELSTLAARAKEMMRLQAGTAKYEAILLERNGRIEALEEQVKELKELAARLKSQNDALAGARERTAA
jgi:hypothetical protein